MLTLPSRFIQESRKRKNDPFAVLTVYSDGAKDEVSTEIEWGTDSGGRQIDSANVDWDSTPTPPESGNVILQADPASSAQSETANIWPVSAAGSTWGFTDNDPAKVNNDDDASYVKAPLVAFGGPVTGRVQWAPDCETLLSIDENVEIFSVKLIYRAKWAGHRPDNAYSRIYWNGDYYNGTNIGDNGTAAMTTSWAEYTDEWTTVPDSSIGWTRDDLVVLTQMGFYCNIVFGDSDVYLSSIKMVVTVSSYLTGGHITYEFDLSGQGVNHDNEMLVSISQREPVGSSLTHELFRPTGGTGYLRPTNHYDVLGHCVNESNGYDGNDSTSCTITITGEVVELKLGQDSGNNDAWAESNFIPGATLTLKITWAWPGTVQSDGVEIYLYGDDGSTYLDTVLTTYLGTKQTTSFVVPSAYAGNPENLRVFIAGVDVLDGTGNFELYDIWLEGEVWSASGIAVKDGDRVGTEGCEEFRIKSTFSGNGSVTPVLSSVELSVPNKVYRFSSKRLPGWPYPVSHVLQDIPGRTLELDLSTYLTKTSKMNVKLNRTPVVMDLLRAEYLKNLDAEIHLGLYYEGIVPGDMIPYYSGKVQDFSNEATTSTLVLQDETKSLQAKWPEPSPPQTKPSKEYDGVHIVDVIRDIVDEVGIRNRYVNEASFYEAKLNCGSDVSLGLTSSDWLVYRVADSVNPTDIRNSKEAKTYITQLLELIGAYLPAHEDGKLNLVIYSPATGAANSWTAKNFGNSISFDAGLDSLRNAIDVYFDWDGEGTDSDDFYSLYVTENSPSKANYQETARRIIKSEWLRAAASAGYYGEEMAAYITARESSRLRNGLGRASCDTPLDQAGLQLGDFVEIQSDVIVKPDIGEGDFHKFMIVKKVWDLKGNKIKWALVEAR